MPDLNLLIAAGSKPKEDLIAQGYTRRTTAAEPRLSELVTHYKEIGHDVEVIEFKAESNGCDVCFNPTDDCAGSSSKKKNAEVYYDIYVRTKA